MNNPSKAEMARLEEIRGGRLYPRSQKTGTTQKLVNRGLAVWLKHAITGNVFVRITQAGADLLCG